MILTRALPRPSLSLASRRLAWTVALALSPWPLLATGCGGDDGDGGSSGGGSGNSGGSQLVGECVPTCMEDADCYTPTEEVCVDGQCRNDCMAKGCVHDGLDCVDLGAVTSCERICTSDDDCGGDPCAGEAADGTKFCVYPDACMSDADCAGELTDTVCNLATGTCGCKSDDHCDEYTTCAN